MIDTIRVGQLTVLRAAPSRPTRAPVLFVHGYFADATVWTEWLMHFAAHGAPAYAVNLRGRAESGGQIDLGATSIDDFAEDAGLVARQLGCPAVVGHSMGGLIAQRLAERDAVRAAVLITPAPPRGIPLLNARLALKQVTVLPRLLMSRVIEPDFEALRALSFNRTPRELQNAILSRLVPDSGRAGREMSMTGVPVDRTKVRCPMLVIAASDDRFIPARIVAKVAKRYDAVLETVADHGHMVVVEPGWEALAERIARWLWTAA